MFRGAIVIAEKDLRQRLRDRSAFVLGFVAPFVIAALMNFAFRDAERFHADLGLVDADRSALSAEIGEVLGSDELRDIISVRTFETRGAARVAVDDGTVGAAIVVPAGFESQVTGNAETGLEVLTSVDATGPAEVARSIATSFTSQLSAVRLQVAAAVAAGAPVEDLRALADDALSRPASIATVEAPTGNRELKGVAYYGPGMAMFFVLFAIGFTARGFFAERSNGTLDRLVAAPIAPSAVLAGKALSVFVYALASLTTMSFAVGAVFGASWGNPLAVLAVCVAVALAVVALAAMVMSVARSERQAETLSSAITFAFALLGGSFVFLGGAPTMLRRLATLTPNGWALRAYTDLATGEHALDAVGRPILSILVFTVVVGGVALVFGRKAVLR
jgi:ABC-2 type transport system permease protein